MKISKNTVLKYSPYTTALTKAVKNADRLHVQRVDNDVYICDGCFAARLNLSEYDVLVRSVTQRDAGDYVMNGGEVEDGAKPIDIADVLAKTERKEVSALTLTPFMIGASNRKKNEACMVTYYSEEAGFVLGLNSDYDAMIKPKVLRSSKKSVAPVLFFKPDFMAPFAMILPVKMNAETADAIRTYYTAQKEPQEKLEEEKRKAEELERLERENAELKRGVAILQEELKESRSRIAMLAKPVSVSDREPKEKIVESVILSGDCPDFELTENMKVTGDFEWSKAPITSLPAGLKVCGDMYIARSQNLATLPSDLEVGNNLEAYGSSLTVYPSGVKVGGNIDLTFTPLERFEAREVSGKLDLCASRVTYLPDGLSVKGDLNLFGTPIEALPAGLKVGGDLILTDTLTSSLPNDLEVGGDLDLRGTNVKEVPPSVKVSGEILWDIPMF